ncbi:MAG TPA: TlpA disulfide reductase family protein [Gaiellaceae bacterium]|nr:TlpA disulfide reductase family protein [Gaiellaceae bacterium]
MSAGILLALRLLLAAVLAAAAAAKLADRSRLRETVVSFGLPRTLAPAAPLLPAVELAAAALLLPASTAWLGGLAALGLLVVFTAAVAGQLARGRRPECNCFGAVHAKPIGPATLARNGALLGCAAAVVAAGHSGAGPSATAWLADPLLAAIGALGLLAAGQAALLVVLLRRHGHVLARLDELESGERARLAVGDEAPRLALPDLGGELVTLEDLLAPGVPALLLFSHPACGPCAALLPEVGSWQRAHEDELTVAVISSGDLDDDRARAEEHGLTVVLRDDDDRVAQAYGATGTPMALLVGPDGRVASELVVGATAIHAVVSTVVEPTTREVLLGV